MELPAVWGRFERPAAHAVRAQLLAALFLVALLPVFLLSHPIPIHAVKLDVWTSPEDAGHIRQLSRAPPMPVLLSIVRRPYPDPNALLHRLDLNPDGTIAMDGEVVDLTGLRSRLDLIVGTTPDWLELRPHPETRYELFLEVLAVTKWAKLERLVLDNGAYEKA